MYLVESFASHFLKRKTKTILVSEDQYGQTWHLRRTWRGYLEDDILLKKKDLCFGKSMPQNTWQVFSYAIMVARRSSTEHTSHPRHNIKYPPHHPLCSRHFISTNNILRLRLLCPSVVVMLHDTSLPCRVIQRLCPFVLVFSSSRLVILVSLSPHPHLLVLIFSSPQPRPFMLGRRSKRVREKMDGKHGGKRMARADKQGGIRIHRWCQFSMYPARLKS